MCVPLELTDEARRLFIANGGGALGDAGEADGAALLDAADDAPAAGRGAEAVLEVDADDALGTAAADAAALDSSSAVNNGREHGESHIEVLLSESKAQQAAHRNASTVLDTRLRGETVAT